jgi:ribonuclease P protein component
MKKDRSNYSLSSHDDLSLPRAKILRGRKNFKRLFERDALICHRKFVDLRYQIINETSFGCLMGFIVKKSLGKANKRNHMKRLLREVYRLHQNMLSEPLKAAPMTFHGALMAKSVDVTYTEVEKDVVALLNEVRNQHPTISFGNS